MTIKSDVGVATGMSGILATKAIADKQTVQYAEKSNLTAVGTGKIQGEKSSQLMEQYQTLLTGDANHISTMGIEFEALNQKITQQMKLHF